MSTALAGGPRPRTFRHGVHPEQHKQATCALPIERMSFVREYVLPLSQHIGAPARAVVEAGQRVRRGQLIAEPAGFVSTALHAPVTGRVRAVELRLHPGGKMMPAVVIEADAFDSQRLPAAEPVDPASLDADQMVERVQRGGLVGLGGAAFPSHVKFKVPEDKRVRYVVINGCECEPYLTCDHRLMVERADAALRGTEIMMTQLRAARGAIGVEANKPDAIEALRTWVDVDAKPVKSTWPGGGITISSQAASR